jgi:uncharacterized membrane protein YkoI
MSESTNHRLAVSFSALIGLSALLFLYGTTGVDASNDHDAAQLMRQSGEIMPLVRLLQRPELAEYRVIEAELEREDGRLVYELELLDSQGRVFERYFDARSGEPLRQQPAW